MRKYIKASIVDGRWSIVKKKYVLYVPLILLLLCGISYAQYPLAQISEKELYTFDVARPLKHFDALADGSDWFAVDEFGFLQTIIIRGTRFERRYNEIPVGTAQFSPNGNYLIWMGLDRSYDEQGFNTTRTTVYKTSKKSVKPDSIYSVTSDNNELFFSKSGKHWAATMPAAKSTQTGVRDVVLVDGHIAAKDNPKPEKFSFSHDEKDWAYRSTSGQDENMITKNSVLKIYTRKIKDPMLPSPDPVVYYYSPDLISHSFLFESRDYEFEYAHPAMLFKTSYLLDRQDTAHSYIIFHNKREPNFRWVSSIQIDTSGNHIAYFACDPASEAGKNRNEKHGVLIEDGKIVAGPYDETGRVFLSPSGKNIAWTAKEGGEASLYLNGKKIGPVGDYSEILWTPDEKNITYITSDEHQKLYVVANGKRSPSFDRMGRVGWTQDNTALEFCAIKYNKLVHIKQTF